MHDIQQQRITKLSFMATSSFFYCTIFLLILDVQKQAPVNIIPAPKQSDIDMFLLFLASVIPQR